MTITNDEVKYSWNPKDKWIDTGEYYECDGFFAEEGTQPYPERKSIELKPLDELKKTADLQSATVLYPGHPSVDQRHLGNVLGELINIHFEEDIIIDGCKKNGIAGRLKVKKSRAKKNPPLEDKIKANSKIWGSFGWDHQFGPGGTHKGERFERTQTNLKIDHLALLFKGETPRCATCGAPYTTDESNTDTCSDCDDKEMEKVLEDIKKCPAKRDKLIEMIVNEDE